MVSGLVSWGLLVLRETRDRYMVGPIRFPSLSLERKEHKKVGLKETVRSGVMWLRVLTVFGHL